MANRLTSVGDLEQHQVTDRSVVILPLGATEQHGPHLPPETDTLIAEGVCERLIGVSSDMTQVHILPAEPIGYSPEHMDHPATRTLSFDEAINRWLGIGEALSDSGVRRFVLLNAHGGNVPLVTIVCQELRVRRSMLAVATKWDRFTRGSAVVSNDEEAFGVHGGDIETSVMLALRPDLVDMDRAQMFRSAQQDMAARFAHLRAYGAHAFGWKAADLNPEGVTGDATAATSAKGEALLEVSVRGLRALLEDVQSFDLSLLKDA